MMLARVCRGGLSPTLVSFIKTPIVPKPMLTKIQPSRLFANDGRTAFTRTARRNQTVAEKLAQPATETRKFQASYDIRNNFFSSPSSGMHLIDNNILAFNVGKAILAGASAFGLGSLCYYGLGLDSSAGAIDQMQYVHTHLYMLVCRLKKWSTSLIRTRFYIIVPLYAAFGPST